MESYSHPIAQRVVNRRVIFVNRFYCPDQSATAQILTDLAQELVQRGSWAITVVTSRLLYENPHAKLRIVEDINGVRVHRVWSTRFGRYSKLGRLIDYGTFYLAAALKLFLLTDKNSIVVAKTDPPLLALFVGPIAKMHGAIFVNWLQDVFPEVARVLGVKYVQGHFFLALRFLRNMTLRMADVNVVICEKMSDVLREQGVPMARTTVIGNWANGRTIYPVARNENKLRTAWGLHKRFVVGYSGNFGRAHEFNTILDAASHLRDRCDIVFVFVGGGVRKKEIEDGVRIRKLQNVVFEVYQSRDQLAESLGVADVHLITLQSSLEGLIFPSKFYGITAAGRAVIFVGDPNGEISQTVRENGIGVCVSPGSGAMLAVALEELADNPARWQQMGRKARRLFDSKYDRSIAIEAWCNALRETNRSLGNKVS